jgi:hypothetical protein
VIYILCALLLASVVFNVYLVLKNARYDGNIIITRTDEGKKLFSLEDVDPEDIEQMNIVRFRVSDFAE